METIRKLRGRMGLTQVELAKKIGVSRATMNSYERPSFDHIPEKAAKKLCSVFNVTEFELYGIDNIRFKPTTPEEAKTLIREISERYIG